MTAGGGRRALPVRRYAGAATQVLPAVLEPAMMRRWGLECFWIPLRDAHVLQAGQGALIGAIFGE
jgi:hypothetical protein